MCGGPRVLISVVAALGLVAGACGSDDDTEAAGGEITVFAAASLTAAFEEIGAAFMAEYPDADVTFNFAASSELATQIIEGAPADVFASANTTQMDAVADLVAAEPRLFAKNHLVIAVPAGNPAGVTTLADLEDPAIVSVICAPQVPCGAATAELAALDGLTLAPASEEQSVSDVLAKVASGQADAGVVYATDIARADGVEAVAIEGTERVLTRYPIAPLDGAAEPALAADFVDYVMGPEARGMLTASGFGVP
ncbi:MAG: molybdate ABC transporter substrate-binding protein [Gemmatimonadetes bacterium]|nr:molybdate ABC transporter substrate-binding protein [Gemmatimonadota bacterium]